MEGLGPSMDRLDLRPEQQINALCATLARAWQVPLPPGPVTPHGKARGLHTLITLTWSAADPLCSRRVVDQALEFADRRSADASPERCVVVHGEPHPGNALQVTDPREGAESAMASGLDEESIWEWGFLERVSTGLYASGFGATSLGMPYLRTAELLVR
ncbi:MAG: streptomycin 6-kinase [Cryptosporangiaceae bacterium]|nr:streptomycin 6-kinase [Cryptosporangiaceae bacterium]